MKYFCLTLLSLVLSWPLLAQQAPELSAQEKTKVIESISRLLAENYIFPDKATEMGNYLKKRHKEKAYQSITDYRAFTNALANDLQKAHKDLHLGLFYSPQQVQQVRRWEASPEPGPEMLEEQLQFAKKENFGFVRVERLPGNIGYLDFRMFSHVNETSKKTVAAAMAFMAHTDAVILDLRNNGGGHPEMVQLILSYFLNETPVHYNSLYNRTTNSTKDYYSLAAVDGKKMPEVDLYVLTSKRTFSAAEEFTYNVKNLKRGTIIGETTGGGAHPTRPFAVNDFLVLHIPFERAISPFTKTNWEGVGIAPDEAVPADKALEHAQLTALNKRIGATQDPGEKAKLEWHLQALQASLNPVQVGEELKATYAGVYEDRKVFLENGELYYQRNEHQKMKMIPLNESTFRFDELEYFRVHFKRNSSGKVEKLVGVYDNGNTDESLRTSNL